MAIIRLFKKISVLHYAATAITALILLLCIFMSLDKYNQIDTSKSRQYFSLVQNELASGKEPRLDGVDYAVISFDGTVQRSTVDEYAEGRQAELKTLAGINGTKRGDKVYFSSPLLENDTQTGTLLLLIDIGLVRVGGTGAILWIIASGALCLALIASVLGAKLAVKKDIAEPIYTLSRIAKKMASGDYGEKLLYDYTDEIGGLCHDIESLRDELISSRERESVLKKNEKFLLACISHDLKTPLAIISGTAESLKDDIITPREASDKILNKTETLTKLINDILEQTKTELNEFSVVLSECYAKAFFEKELADLEPQAQTKGLSYFVSPCPDCIVNIDKQRVTQVLQNLVGNAIKYTPYGGSITVSFEVKNGLFIVSVKDTGVGISAADLPFIFDKFYRGEKARSTETVGSGLGLPISKYIIEKHGGSLECDTVLSKGTEMRFSLPLN